MSTENITGTTINRIRRSAKRGETMEVHDLIQPGMSIRVTGRRMSWYCRFSTPAVRDDGKKVRTARAICAVDACADPVKMRTVVAAGCAALKEGRDPLAAVRSMLAKMLGMPETRVPDNPSVQTWDFKTFREEFNKDPPAHLRQPTVEGYYRAMSEAQVGKAVFAKRLVELTAQDIRRIRDDIKQRGHGRQSSLTLTALRIAFEWAAESPRSALSGLTEDNNPMVQVVTKRRSKRKPTPDDDIAAADLIKIDEDQHVVVKDPNLMSMMDIGKLLILLLHPTKLPLVKRAILLLLLYSVQRRRTVAAAIRKALVGFLQHNVAFWVLHGGTTKSGRPRILPFSMVAWQIIDNWKATLSDEVWLFPGMPTRRKPNPDGHLNVRTVNAWLDEACVLAGCERRHNPHAIRGAFGSYLSKKKVSKADRKLILDHAEGRAGDVTEVHYNRDPKLPEKQKVMGIWNTFLDECVEMADGSVKAHSFVNAGFGALELAGGVAEPPVRPQQQNALPSHQSPTRQSASAVGDSDAARLQKLRANLESRKKIDASLERAPGRRSA